MSAIEEAISRISLMTGVENYVIVDKNGVILRHSKGFTQDEAADFSGQLMELTQKAQHVVRDLEPRNELELFRVRGKEREILVAPGADFLVLILQRWRVAQLE